MLDIKESKKQLLDDFKVVIERLGSKAEKEVMFNGENAVGVNSKKRIKVIDSVNFADHTDIKINFSSIVTDDKTQNRLKVLAVGGIIMTEKENKKEPVEISGSKSLKGLLDIAKKLKVK